MAKGKKKSFEAKEEGSKNFEEEWPPIRDIIRGFWYVAAAAVLARKAVH